MASNKLTRAGVRALLRRIVPWASETNTAKGGHNRNYKGVRGRIGIVGGARDYSGAPYFASISAMRLGADLAYVICSASASQSIKGYSPDLIVMPILDCPDDEEFETEMSCLLDRLHALVIGPGLGRESHLQTRVKKLIIKAKELSLPLVLDADSLILINEDPSIVRSYPKALLTPNRIELQRMLCSLYKSEHFDLRTMSTEDVKKLVQRCSHDMNVCILAKGSVDIVSCGDIENHLVIEETLGSSRRCGGQGDILSGLAGVYLHWIEMANGESLEKIANPTALAACLAAITTRQCNEIAYKDFGSGMLASDMISKLDTAISSLLSSDDSKHTESHVLNNPTKARYVGSLTQDEICRYSRQMIMSEFGPERQLNLKQSSAIIVGAGGLGCPSAIYLGAGGIGRLGIVDDDKVEISNLHRQVLHSVKKTGMLKTESIKEAILDINPNVKVDTFPVRMNRENAVRLIEDYDIVIDATDNLLSRYMISDACVVAKKPLISGAALKTDGQLTVYNFDNETPCFRCLFPEPPLASAVGSCSENGVLGVLPGVIGVLQAMEAIKIGAGIRPAYAGKMLLYDGQIGLFRQITLSKRKADCQACGQTSKLSRDLIDYEQFLGSKDCEKLTRDNNVLDPSERVSVEQYRDILESGEAHVLVDVRPSIQSEVSRFAHALQIPLSELMQEKAKSLNSIKGQLESNNANHIYVVCRKGIASQRGVRIIQELFAAQQPKVMVKDIAGGMTAWAQQIDTSYSCL